MLLIHVTLSVVYYMTCFLCYSTPTSETSTLSLHYALPISRGVVQRLHFESRIVSDGGETAARREVARLRDGVLDIPVTEDRKSTRLNSSHLGISYAVFCLKKKQEPEGRWQRNLGFTIDQLR